MNVAIYEKNEVGFGHGMFIVDMNDFNIQSPEEKIYLESIKSAIKNEDLHGYGAADCYIMLHNIIQGGYGTTNVKELKLPCNIDFAVYIYACD